MSFSLEFIALPADVNSPVPLTGLGMVVIGGRIQPINSANGCSLYIQDNVTLTRQQLTLIPRNPMEASPSFYAVDQVYIPASLGGYTLIPDNILVGSQLIMQQCSRILVAYHELTYASGKKITIRNQTGYNILLDFIRMIPGD